MTFEKHGVWVCLFLFALAAKGAHASEPMVLLNEILADPATDWDGSGLVSSRDDEWVEIVNAGTAVADLSEYRLASADTCWRYQFSGVLSPGAVKVVYGGESYAWEDATGNPRFGLRLGNSGGDLYLWRFADGDSGIVDGYAYADHEADDDRSTGRAPDGATTWRVFDGMNPLPGGESPAGTGCNPSPGSRLSCPTPVEQSTWGRIKRVLGGVE